MRSQTPQGVVQELWGVLLAYNLVRREMEQVANEANVSPLRISFIASYCFVRDEFLWCAVARPGTIPAHLKRLRQQLSLRQAIESLHLITPFLRWNGLVPALVAIEVESHGHRNPRRGWRRNDTMCRGAESFESPSVGLRASA